MGRLGETEGADRGGSGRCQGLHLRRPRVYLEGGRTASPRDRERSRARLRHDRRGRGGRRDGATPLAESTRADAGRHSRERLDMGSERLRGTAAARRARTHERSRRVTASLLASAPHGGGGAAGRHRSGELEAEVPGRAGSILESRSIPAVISRARREDLGPLAHGLPNDPRRTAGAQRCRDHHEQVHLQRFSHAGLRSPRGCNPLLRAAKFPGERWCGDAGRPA
jgi:hypothetical protein